MRNRSVVTVKKVSATRFRTSFKACAEKARGQHVILIENRRQGPKYLVDKAWLDEFVRQREVIQATLEVLADRELTDRLLGLAQTVDKDVRAGRLHSMEELFGK